jgi:hypothetical protein
MLAAAGESLRELLRYFMGNVLWFTVGDERLKCYVPTVTVHCTELAELHFLLNGINEGGGVASIYVLF